MIDPVGRGRRAVTRKGSMGAVLGSCLDVYFLDLVGGGYTDIHSLNCEF